MTFLRPEVLNWLWVLPIIPLLYLVRRRSRRVDVPHLFLWERVLNRESKTKVNRIRDLLSIFLQVAIAATIIFAWAGPTRESETEERGRLLLLVDSSASMSARRNDGKTRLQAALDLVARRLPGWLESRDVGLTAVGDGSREVAAIGSDVEPLVLAMENWPRPEGRLDVPGMQQLVESLRREDERLDVIYVGDGAADGEAAPDGLGFFPVGDDRANAGILKLELRDDRERGEVLLDVTVAAYGGDVAGRLAIQRAEDDEILSAVPFTLAAGTETTLQIRAEAESEQWLSARLLASEDQGALDALTADDEAGFWFSGAPKAHVLVVADEVLPRLKDGIAVLAPWVDLEKASVVKRDRWRQAAGQYDLIILQEIEETSALPAGHYLLLDSWSPDLPLARSEESKDVTVLRQATEGLLLRGLDLRNLRIEKAWRCEPREGARTLLSGSSGSLISEGSYSSGKGDVRFVHLSFSPSESNSSLALLPAWPLFLKDVVLEAGEARRRVFPEAVPAGRGFPLRRLSTTPPGLVPSAHPLQLEGAGAFPLESGGPGAIFLAPEEPGGYLMSLGDRSENVAVNRLGPGISDLVPRWRPRGEPELKANRKQRRETELGPWLGFLALLFLILEGVTFAYGRTR